METVNYKKNPALNIILNYVEFSIFIKYLDIKILKRNLIKRKNYIIIVIMNFTIVIFHNKNDGETHLKRHL